MYKIVTQVRRVAVLLIFVTLDVIQEGNKLKIKNLIKNLFFIIY